MAYYVYIMASKRNGTLYIGVTNDLVRRVYEHRDELADGFTKKCGVKDLVYFESHDDIARALQRTEKLEAMAAGLEDRSDREGKPGLARSL